ncbi:MAG: Tfp pilus assembly protein FimT/FimU [Planctomycetaceae bacterium]
MRSRLIRPKKRSGYTLFEMLMVQALLVAMVAASWPALRSPLGKSQLVDAAKQLRVELIKARHRAIETGVAQQFRYQPGADVYEIAPAGKKSSEKNSLSARMKTESRSGSFDNAEEAEVVTCRKLPSDISFADGSTQDESDSDRTTEVVSKESQQERTTESWSVGDEEWSSPVVFHPNGRTSNAKISLRGASDFQIEVSLRGLTGIASIGDAHRAEEARR